MGWICSACSGEREIIVQGGTSVRSSAFLWKAVEEGSDFSQARAQQEDKRQQVHTCSKGNPCLRWKCSGTSVGFPGWVLCFQPKDFQIQLAVGLSKLS